MKNKEWVASKLNCPVDDVKKLYTSTVGIDFLLVWTQYETLCFNGVYDKKSRKDLIARFIDMAIDITPLEESFEYFYNRYLTNYDYLKGLFNNKKTQKDFLTFQRLLSKQKESLTIEDKLTILLLVVGRYRNNLFHGNKCLKKWLSYENEIFKCVEVMKNITNLSYRG